MNKNDRFAANLSLRSNVGRDNRRLYKKDVSIHKEGKERAD
jgi:hypothetical protein